MCPPLGTAPVLDSSAPLPPPPPPPPPLLRLLERGFIGGRNELLFFFYLISGSFSWKDEDGAVECGKGSWTFGVEIKFKGIFLGSGWYFIDYDCLIYEIVYGLPFNYPRIYYSGIYRELLLMVLVFWLVAFANSELGIPKIKI